MILSSVLDVLTIPAAPVAVKITLQCHPAVTVATAGSVIVFALEAFMKITFPESESFNVVAVPVGEDFGM
jgi:hypothetical protein